MCPLSTQTSYSLPLCFCGNPLFYKDCHGLGMEEAINNDLAQVLENLHNDNANLNKL